MASLLGRRQKFFGGGDQKRRRWYDDVDKILWGVPLGLTALAGGLIASTQRQASYADWYDHWITAAVGMALALILARLPLERINSLLAPLYGLTVVSLLAVRFVGTSALGAQRWISIAGFHVQPSEFAKMAAILLLAGVLARYPIERPVDLIRPSALIGLPWILVFIQPDLGTSLVFGAVLLVMLFWAGMPTPWLVLLLSPLVAAILAGSWPWALAGWIPLMTYLAWSSLPWQRVAMAVVVAIQGLFALITPYLWLHGLKDYQRDRLLVFLDPAKDPLGAGYHLMQSKIGIGSGEWFGTGLLQGHLTKLRFIPEQHTDFIFSALGEEMGFLGCLLVICAYGLLMWRLLVIARQARSDFESLVVVGVGAMLMFQILVNIFMTIGLGPVTGIPLPWMSYGRSAMLVNFAALGFCSSVARRGKANTEPW
ncbi:rod shape-determining protein RodA [Cyanobium sp. WAJ14-Wanaka]|uniref:rod shape-determining protein RodA n=1 Tax=Cyanobium sp. WAJ14-Wanaka TaxID=2823725 RepID=UPI0020CD02E2|nr:rod shape-determining protein RodA [Cyanobium sp. WAJ14-Wanaka]MCP9776004.1 rod shape-determining protein RodA [Cyanobium sp. WAJ14-Wanaka]